MPAMSFTIRPILLLLALCAPVSGHLSFNLVVDAEGNVYFLEVFDNSLLKVTPDGKVSELVDLREVSPEERLHALAMDRHGHLYVGGYLQEKVWKVSPSGEVSSVYPFPGKEPLGGQILHVGFDAVGSLYILEWRYGAGQGPGQKFRLLKFSDPEKEPVELFVSTGGEENFVDLHRATMLVARDGTVYFSGAHRIWRVRGDHKLRLVAGGVERGFADGSAKKARFAWPHGMTEDAEGNLLVAELSGRIRKIDSDGVVTTVTGAVERGYEDGILKEARFDQAFALGLGPEGRLYVAEFGGPEESREYRVRVLSEGRVRTVARIPTKTVFRK